ncbi:hypothetical protein ACN27J_05930 [Solwaraspora sp. WMMB762]|uniref:hypothetical protein n=1 Tax=Solwaraspora sp. WMMB762 TaxID=3404120 RepID=UPI003B9530D9
MPLWIAATWGLVGSVVAEALNLYAMMRPTTESKGRWQWPWRTRADQPIIIFAVTLRAVAGTGLAAAAAAGGVATTAFATFVFGVAAPLFIARMFDQVRVVDRGTPPPSITHRSAADPDSPVREPGDESP